MNVEKNSKFQDKRVKGWAGKGDPKGEVNRSNRIVLSKDLEKAVRSLPIFSAKQKIIEAIDSNEVCIVLGETGSGKTTQIPQFVLESGVSGDRMIGVTQPRRVAAISIATRVAQEMSCHVGQTVGYSVRFEEEMSHSTRIKYMTDGMLLREAITDPLLLKYSLLILDEIHERSLQTDILLGIVKRCQKLRDDEGKRRVKIVLMSASMDVDLFSSYFKGCPVYYLAGRQFPIKNMYTVEKQRDYVQSALATVFQVHRNQPEGDILVFCTGQEEIQSMVSAVISATSHETETSGVKLTPMGLYASLPSSQQMQVFEPSVPGVNRKVIFSTNVAETSITIPGIKYVVDTGKVKTRSFDVKTGFEYLKIENISKAQAEQRSGRAGRESVGVCYRLFTEDHYENLEDFSKPEILRVSLTSVVLNLLGIGLPDPTIFDFIQNPKPEAIQESLSQLVSLGAATKNGRSSNYVLTGVGKKMLIFPLDAKFSKVLVSSAEYGCTEEILTIISLLYVESVFYVPPMTRDMFNDVTKKFKSSEGDHLMLLNVFRSYASVKSNKEWCRENFIHKRNMEIAKDVRKQLLKLWDQQGWKRSSCGLKTADIRRCLLQGLQSNVAILQTEGFYQTVWTTIVLLMFSNLCFH